MTRTPGDFHAGQARRVGLLCLGLWIGGFTSGWTGSGIAWGQHSLRGAGPNWGGFQVNVPGGQFTMWQGPVGGWPGFYPQPLGWGDPPGLVYSPAVSPGYTLFPGWGGVVLYPGPVVSYPAGPLAVDPRDLGFGHQPPALPPLPPAEQVDRLQRLPGRDFPGGNLPGGNVFGPGADRGAAPAGGGLPAPEPVAAQPAQDNPPLFLKASNAEQRRRSLRAQVQGDEQMRRLQFLPAVGRYRQATEAAPDLPEPRFRLAWALVCLGEFGQGVEHLRRGLRIDPDWAAHGPGLLELFGPGQHLAADTILQRVAGWVREEIRDPDRLLLLGVLLHFREDARESREVLETAAALGGETSSARQFLESLNRLAAAPPVPRGPAAHDTATREPPPAPLPEGARLGPRTDPPNGRGPAGNDQSVIRQPSTPRSIPTATPRPNPGPLPRPNPGPNPGPQAGGIAEEELEPAPVPHPPEEEAAAPASVFSDPVSPAPVPPAAAPVVRARTGGATSGRSGSRATGAANRGEVRPRLSPPA